MITGREWSCDRLYDHSLRSSWSKLTQIYKENGAMLTSMIRELDGIDHIDIIPQQLKRECRCPVSCITKTIMSDM